MHIHVSTQNDRILVNSADKTMRVYVYNIEELLRRSEQLQMRQKGHTSESHNNNEKNENVANETAEKSISGSLLNDSSTADDALMIP